MTTPTCQIDQLAKEGFIPDTCAMVDALGFVASKHTGDVADYVIERAFVEK